MNTGSYLVSQNFRDLVCFHQWDRIGFGFAVLVLYFGRRVIKAKLNFLETTVNTGGS